MSSLVITIKHEGNLSQVKKLIHTYKAFSITEILLLISVLLHIAFILGERGSQYLDLIAAFIVFLVPTVISWKILSLTNKNVKSYETLVIIGHIFNFIKILILLILLLGGLLFFTGTNQHITIYNERGVRYYLFFLSLLLFIIVSLLTFVAYFGIAKDNNRKTNSIIQSIGK